MAFQRIGTLALACASGVAAFKDTSPFFAFSTSKQLDGSIASLQNQIVSPSHLLSDLQKTLSDCSSRSYVVVSQPGVSSSDFQDQASAPHLRRWVLGKEQGFKSSLAISEVSGAFPSDVLSKYLAETCGATFTSVDPSSGYISVEEQLPRVIKVEFPSLPSYTEERASKLAQHDSYLNAVLSSIDDKDRVVLYTTSPGADVIPSHTGEKAQQVYEMDDAFPNAPHTELKRDVSTHAGEDSGNVGLFEKYEFFSPGIFMGLTVSIPLLIILYIGINAVASLEVSYFAFSKEMGPSAQKQKQG